MTDPKGWLLVRHDLPYAQGWALQNTLFDLRKAGRIPDILILTEHRPVYTFGKSGKREHLLIPEEQVRKKGIDLFWIDRGGDITYHGPGQLVGYPIFDLHNYYLDIGRFLRDLEAVLIQVLSQFHIAASRKPGLTGVWVGEMKIASIGIKVSRWITKHGFAVNVNTDMHYFQNIVPCGIADKPMTSMQLVLGEPVAMDRVMTGVVDAFRQVFGIALEPVDETQIPLAGASIES